MFRLDFQLVNGWCESVRLRGICPFVHFWLAFFLFSFHIHKNAEYFSLREMRVGALDRSARARKIECVNGINLNRLCLGFTFFSLFIDFQDNNQRY